MTVLRMPAGVWEWIKDINPSTLPEYEGCWELMEDGVKKFKVLYRVGVKWSLVAIDTNPPPPPPDQGRMDLGAWRRIKGGKLIPELNVIEAGAARWQIHHLSGRPGHAVPVVVQELAETVDQSGKASKRRRGDA